MLLGRYRPGLLLALASAGAVLGVSAVQSARKLAPADVDHYIGILERDLPPELEQREEFITRLRSWAENDDGQPVYMLNLMRFFDDLRPGTYALKETQPAGYLDGKDTIGTPGGTAGNDQFANIVLGPGVDGINNNFGEIKPGTLSGFVYVDANNDGIRQAGEFFLNGK